jgi:hypothetical protein
MIIDIGRYTARATEWQMGIAETGTEQVAVTFEVVEEGPFSGHTITWFGFFTEKTSERTIKSLFACGWEGDDLTNLTGLDRNEVEIVVDHDVHKNERRAKVKWVNRPGAGSFVMKNPMNDAQKKALASKMKGLVLSMRKEGVAPSRAPSQPRADDKYPRDWDEGRDGRDLDALG